MRLAGRRILITGGGSGIGLATAERFVTEGAQVAILDRSPQSLARVKNALPGVVALACDVSQEADVQQAVPLAAAHLQGLDGVCNVAGIGTGVAIECDQRLQDIQAGLLLVAGVQQVAHLAFLAAGHGCLDQTAGRQCGGGVVVGEQRTQGLQALQRLLAGEQQLAQQNACTRSLGNGFDRVLQQCQCAVGIALGKGLAGLFAAVMRLAHAEVGFARALQQFGHLRGLWPFARTLVNGQSGQTGLAFVGGSLQFSQSVFGAVEQTSFQKVERQPVLGALSVGAAQVGAGQQVFVHAHGAVVFATAAKQVAQSEMQLRSVGVVLYGFDEGVDGLVLLFVEQVVQALEVGARGLAVGDAQLAQVQARGDPAQGKSQWQADQDPGQVKLQRGSPVASVGMAGSAVPGPGVRPGAGATSAAPCPAPPCSPPGQKRSAPPEWSGLARTCQKRSARGFPAGCSGRTRTG